MKAKRKISPFQMILIGFSAAILFGACLLSLPFSAKNREWTNFFDALFTSTSAVCVTGLVVVDTATHFSFFGQTVLLLLIQIGGMGVITLACALALLSGRKIGLFGRDVVKESIAAPSVGGVIKLTLFVLKGIFLVELVGALVMLPVFCRDFGWQGVWMSFFHSVSAFCNAGFDIMGGTGQSSLSYYQNQPLINITIMLLIITGGIGFLVWSDVCEHKWRLKRYSLQSKVVLLTSALLIVFPSIYFFFGEYATQPFKTRLFLSLFQAVTPRTAGFNTANLLTMKEIGLLMTIGLMLIGGSPGSTAGGMKTTTLAVLFSSAFSVFRRKENAETMKRRIDDKTVKSAAALFLLYLVLFSVCGCIISAVENLPLLPCLFETASAIGTVGLSLSLTPSLGAISKILLIFLMFFGRVGGLTLLYAAFGQKNIPPSKLPVERITVG